MMREVHCSRGIRVLDEVLTPAELRRLQGWAERVQYRGVHHESWRNVWRLGDGEPLRGPTWWAGPAGRGAYPDAAASGPPDGIASAIPAELEPLARMLQGALLVGAREGARVSLTPWVYPSGTALGLHRDGKPYGGSYVYYFMPEWDVHWGGLLHCVSEPRSSASTPRAVLLLEEERASLAGVAGGVWVTPACNRMVLLEPQVRHFVSRIDPGAGDRSRLSIAGFVHPAP